MTRDLIVIDFINFLARLRLSEPILSSGAPSIMQIRKYCTRLGWGGYNMEKERWDNISMIKVPNTKYGL